MSLPFPVLILIADTYEQTKRLAQGIEGLLKAEGATIDLHFVDDLTTPLAPLSDFKAIIFLGPESRRSLYLQGEANGLKVANWWCSKERAGWANWIPDPNALVSRVLDCARSQGCLKPARPDWKAPTRAQATADLQSFISSTVGAGPDQFLKHDPVRGFVDPDPNPDHLKLVVNVADLMSIPGSGWEDVAYYLTSEDAQAVRRARKAVQECQKEIELMGHGLVHQHQVDALDAAKRTLSACERNLKPYKPKASP